MKDIVKILLENGADVNQVARLAPSERVRSTLRFILSVPICGEGVVW
jgi:hypothetical protein